MSSWYVSYQGGCATVMSIARSRDEAISIACGMLGRASMLRKSGHSRECGMATSSMQ